MSKAMMSGGWLPNAGAQRFINERGGPRTEAEAVAHSLREAERILSETEPTRAYGAIAPNTDLLHIERIVGSGREDGCGRTARYEGCVALVESLSAVLPVLDELAFKAGHPGNMPTFEPWAEPIWRSNRATLDAMGGR